MSERIDQQPRRMRFLGKERAVEHRRLEHRYLQAADQRLDAVGKILGFEYEIEQHRHQLDGHRLELVGARTEGRLLQIAQDVVHVLLQPRELNWNTAKVESSFPVLQPPERISELRRDQDARAAEGTDRRNRGRFAARAVASGRYAQWSRACPPPW